MQMQMCGEPNAEWNGEGSGEIGKSGEPGKGQTLGVRITDALNWTGLANPEEKVFGCCPHESIVLRCFVSSPLFLGPSLLFLLFLPAFDRH